MDVRQGIKLNINYEDVVKSVVRRTNNIKPCAVCYSDNKASYYDMSDPVSLPQYLFLPHQLPLLEVLSSSGYSINKECVESTVVCQTCLCAAVNAYSFKVFCEYSQNLYIEVKRSHSQDNTEPIEESGPAVASSSQMSNNNASSSLQCSVCGKLFNNSKLFNNHSCAQKSLFRCEICVRDYQSKYSYEHHVNRVHREKTLGCPECERKFASQSLLNAHRKASHSPRNCAHCDKVLYTAKAWKQHEAAHFIKWTCNCGKVFKYQNNFKTHQSQCKVANPDARVKKYECATCGKTYSLKKSLRQHITYAHTENSITCQICDKPFITTESLEFHMSFHTGSKNYKCKVCSKKFSTPSTLKYHVRAMHTKEKPYKCNDCAESFVTSARLIEHKRKKHGAPGPTCDTCGLKFATNSQLKRHSKTHAVSSKS